MKVLISLLLLCVFVISGAALTIEEEYILHSEGLIANSYAHIAFTAENIQVMLTALYEDDGIDVYAYNLMTGMLAFIAAELQRFGEAVYTAETQMNRLKAEYNRRDE